MKCNFFHVVTIALAAIEQVLARGLITGWPFINFILKREGFLNYLCQNGTNISTTVTCAEQDQAIGRYFSIMNALNTFIVLPFAVFMYNFDLFKSRIGCSFLVTGALFFGIFTIVTLALVYYDDVPSMWKFPLMSLAVILCAIAFGFVARSSENVNLPSSSISPSTVGESTSLEFVIEKPPTYEECLSKGLIKPPSYSSITVSTLVPCQNSSQK